MVQGRLRNNSLFLRTELLCRSRFSSTVKIRCKNGMASYRNKKTNKQTHGSYAADPASSLSIHEEPEFPAFIIFLCDDDDPELYTMDNQYPMIIPQSFDEDLNPPSPSGYHHLILGIVFFVRHL
ncbi:hypothetical protein NPIL_546161 [Nephila pilipes]|uniref:Uncharacterized protein n=1 Tax=Nephila pilipes TaxID=299642 RepID=A0A8X6N6V3_NEPPI|nr:hypothetical protein NPIL_546161 [Nephila pilipes]